MMAKENKAKFYDPNISRGPTEFNQMALFLFRLDQRANERDIALNDGEVERFFRCTMSIFLNCIPRFKQKGMSDEEIKKSKEALLNIGKKVKSFSVAQGPTRAQNSFILEEDLFNYNLELNQLMFTYGLIFPLKEIQKLEKIIEEDF